MSVDDENDEEMMKSMRIMELIILYEVWRGRKDGISNESDLKHLQWHLNAGNCSRFSNQ